MKELQYVSDILLQWLFVLQCVFSRYVSILTEEIETPNPIMYFSMTAIKGME